MCQLERSYAHKSPSEENFFTSIGLVLSLGNRAFLSRHRERLEITHTLNGLFGKEQQIVCLDHRHDIFEKLFTSLLCYWLISAEKIAIGLRRFDTLIVFCQFLLLIY